MAKVFADTNVFFAASLVPGSVTADSLRAVLYDPHRLFLSQYVIDECLAKLGHPKFRSKSDVMKRFFDSILPWVNIVETPEEPVPEEEYITDPKDRPILRAAIAAKVDLLVSGDKHFLNARSRIDAVEIVDPQDFFYRILGR